MPISCFLEFLLISGNYEEYMEKLVTSFNPSAAQGVMCRNTISISWDGYIYMIAISTKCWRCRLKNRLLSMCKISMNIGSKTGTL